MADGFQLLTREEAARALRVSKVQLWRITTEGRLPVVRIGRRALFRASDIESLIRQCLEGGPTRRSRRGGAA